MSGDVADSTDARSALSQVETGKGLLFWGMQQESTGGSELLQIIMEQCGIFSRSVFQPIGPQSWVLGNEGIPLET